jgi:sugar lactone lactonase YvrE
MNIMRRTSIVLALLLMLAVSAVPALAAPGGTFPNIIPLPDGWQPEGIAVGRGTTFYAGSLANGAIYRGDLRSGDGSVLVAGQPGGLSVGLALDTRSNYLFAAGGLNGNANVYDGSSGALLATFQLTTPFAGFVNDVIVTRDAAYFTDSFQPQLYRVALGAGGSLPAAGDFQTIPLGGDWVQVPGPFVFNANGIEASADGKTLLVVHSNLGQLYKVDPQTGAASLVNLGGASLTAGDGLALQGRTLYVVRNQLNQIAVVNLAPGFSSGSVARTITSPDFRVPTTVAIFGSSLYAVNARFGTPPGPDVDYDVVRVPKN